MAPQLNAAQHCLINILLTQGFENGLIASKASCSVRTVQKIRLKASRLEMHTRNSARVGLGRRCRMTSRMQEALRDRLIEQPYMYRCEMADFLYRGLYRSDQLGGRYDQWVGRERRSVASHNNGTTTFRTITCIGFRSMSPINLSLLMSLAAIGGRDIVVRVGLQRVLLQLRLRDSVVGRDGTSFPRTHKMASY